MSPASRFFASLRQGFHGLLLVAAVGVLVWAFALVVTRWVGNAWTEASHKQITLLHWGTPEEEAIVQHACDAYTKANPGVSILRIQASDFESKLKTMIAAGTPPD